MMRRTLPSPRTDPPEREDQASWDDAWTEPSATGQASLEQRSFESRRETMRTEFAFELPRGYVDEYGAVHRDGVMRLATARDELVPLRDDRVRENPAYLTVVLLGRVVMRIGTITDVHPGLIENFFASDLAFLQDLYRRINSEGPARTAVTCPECRHAFAVDLSGSRLGES